jgi:hypothetical protein
MTRYWLTETATQEERMLVGPDANGDDVVALACPWHADPTLSCICDLTYGQFWCVTCDREGTCMFVTPWPAHPSR